MGRERRVPLLKQLRVIVTSGSDGRTYRLSAFKGSMSITLPILSDVEKSVARVELISRRG